MGILRPRPVAQGEEVNLRPPLRAPVSELGSLLRALTCRACGSESDPAQPLGTCPQCGGALFGRYDVGRLDAARWSRSLGERPASLWRYRELLPVQRVEHVVTLGEGISPLVSLGPVPEAPGVEVLFKDDGGLPTGSFKARGMALAVSRARELGLNDLYVPSAGNAGVALAAYGARAGARVRVYLPSVTPAPFAETVRRYGAEALVVPGTLREAGATARAQEAGRGSFDLSTLREPYRLQGKKTMGFELWDQLRPGPLPDAVVYPTGGGTGLVGMSEAFRELKELGLIDRAPRFFAIQPEGCAPVVRALREGAPSARPWEEPSTGAPGLLVPAPFASEAILAAVRESGGGGTTVSEEAIRAAVDQLARRHGISACPEGAATYAALRPLVEERWVRPGERVLLYNTGRGAPPTAS